MPRSGSTLLQNLLAQHPNHHCTSTNDLIDMLMVVRDRWMTCTGFVAQGLAKIEPRIKAMMRNMVFGFYEMEFNAGKIVFDKSRGWLSNLELIEQVLERPVKVIVPIRDIRDIIASFEKIFRKSSLTDHAVQGPESFQRLTVQGRAERLLAIEKTVGYMAHCIADAFERGLGDRLVVVPYWELTHHPVKTIERVCFECGIEPFVCNPFNVEQVTQEDDTVYGMQLHTVRKSVEPDCGYSWNGIIPDVLADAISNAFPFIQELASKKYLAREHYTPMATLSI